MHCPKQRRELGVYGGVGLRVEPPEVSRAVTRLRRAFPAVELGEFFPNPSFTTHHKSDGVVVYGHLNLKFNDRPQTLVRDAIAPFISIFQRLSKPLVHAFICHATEDKAAARELASTMTKLGAEVWFDEWEIRVGESIVQKVGDALGAVSHLIVLLSRSSVNKPWVQKELSAALMLQLSKKSIRVLPVRLDDCDIPPILADIRYADARSGMHEVAAQLERGLFVDV